MLLLAICLLEQKELLVRVISKKRDDNRRCGLHAGRSQTARRPGYRTIANRGV